MKSVIKRYDHSIYRLVIRNIQGYGTFQVLPKGTKRAVGKSHQLDQLKQRVLDYLLQQQSKRKVKPVSWSIAWETHAATGLPHLDILIVFEKNIKAVFTAFDYLIKDLKIQQRYVDDQVSHGHVWITPYSPTKLSKAILQYGQKQDPSVITNLTLETKQDLVRLNKLKADPYRHLELQMLQDPQHFNLEQYVRKHDLYQYISNWSSIKAKLKDSQLAAAHIQLSNKKGFKHINRDLIETNLNSEQLKVYDSWKGYQTIVNYLNQIITYGYKRPMKTKNLLITGKPNIGKTSFIEADLNNTRNCIQRYCSVYPMSAKTWWPNYKSEVYQLISWNQAKLTSYSYDTILKVLEGSKVDLPQKGSSTLKYDNPLVLMTSNMTLDQMIYQKFGYSETYFQMARKNLAVRIQNVIVPETHDLFLIQKLLVPV